MEKHAVLSRKEMDARCEIQYEIYIKTINIEALTMIEMAKRQILPAVIDYRGKLASEISSIQSIGQDAEVETDLFARISAALHSFSRNLVQLERNLANAAEMHSQETADQAAAYRDQVFALMNLLREDADLLETLIDQKYWPLPTYSSMLFNV